MSDAEELKKVLVGKPKSPIKAADFLSTGSTLLNLACSGRPRCGFAKGHFYYLVGDSSSGKTFLSLTCFAEACINKNFDTHRLIFDNAENGALMDFERFFGKVAAERIEPPRKTTDGVPIYSDTIQDLYYHLDDAKREGIPFIYVLDSMDALSSKEEQKKVQEQKKSHRKKVDQGKEEKVTGSFGDGKAKVNSSSLRQIMPYIRDSGSILIFISQTRDNLNTFALDKKTRSGGRSLTFYATLEMWSSQAGHIKKKVKEKDRELGIYSKIRIKKNRLVGKDRTVTIPIYHSLGIDDLGSCIDYLIEEDHWKKTNGTINAKEFETRGTREQLVRHIENNDLHRDLQDLVTEVWNEIEELCVVERKSRYE